MIDWLDDIRERNRSWLDNDIEDIWSYIDRNELLKLLDSRMVTWIEPKRNAIIVELVDGVAMVSIEVKDRELLPHLQDVSRHILTNLVTK